VGSKRVLDTTGRRDGFVFAVTSLPVLELVDILDDDVALYAVTRDEGQGFLHDFKFAKTCELIEHHKQAMFVFGLWPPIFKLDLIGQKSHDHVDQNTDQGPQARLVIGLSDDIKAHRVIKVHEVLYSELGFRDVFRYDR